MRILVFFINRKRCYLAIRGVLRDGVWVDEPSLVKEVFRVYFQSLFRRHIRIRPNTDVIL